MANVQDAASEASSLLASAWSYGSDEYRLPVDPFSIAHTLGLQVFTAHLGGDVSGALMKEPNANPVIYVNATDAPNRQRFSCAHELGHYIKRTKETPTEQIEDGFSFVDLRSSLTSTGMDADERYANAFAAALLMPAARLKRLHELYGGSAAALADVFGVSLEAMRYRLENLGLT